MEANKLEQTAPLIVITGPTASGKTSLAIKLAKKFGGEIICADSRTVYRDMDIGTAKPTPMEMQGVAHWGLDLVEPGQLFSAADFKEYATKKIAEIRDRGNIPFLVGGTGLYIDGVIFNFSFANRSDERYRQRLEYMSIEDLHKYCVDNNMSLPENKYNKRYVVRAIERSIQTVVKNASIQENTIVVGIATEKNKLANRVAQRIEQLLTNNVVEEATHLGDKYGWCSEAMTGNVYPIIRQYICSKIDYAEMIQRMVVSDRQLAKRQMTWLRRNPYIVWCDLYSAEHYLSQILAHLSNP